MQAASERREADEILERAGIDRALHRPAACGLAPLIMLNPGAQYGAATCWLPEYFASYGFQVELREPSRATSPLTYLARQACGGV